MKILVVLFFFNLGLDKGSINDDPSSSVKTIVFTNEYIPFLIDLLGRFHPLIVYLPIGFLFLGLMMRMIKIFSK